MSTFPFYDIMIKDVINNDLSVKEKNELLLKIKSIDKSGEELIYALIRVFEINNEDVSSTFKLPYAGKYINSDIQFDLEKLPFKLRQCLFKFVKVHFEKMEEEKMKQNILFQ